MLAFEAQRAVDWFLANVKALQQFLFQIDQRLLGLLLGSVDLADSCRRATILNIREGGISFALRCLDLSIVAAGNLLRRNLLFAEFLFRTH